MDAGLILVHGIFVDPKADIPGGIRRARVRRAKAFARHGSALGVRQYEWVEGGGKKLANRLFRFVRGTARAVDAVEIIELDEVALRVLPDDQPARARWQEMAGCEPYGLDPVHSFILIGAQRLLLDGPAGGRRVLWFGNGLSQLSEAEFIAHYTGRHGPLVAGYSRFLGLRRYRQVPSEQDSLCESLRELGLGRAVAPAVFAELVMGRPPFDVASMRARRSAMREIGIDEKRHIDFRRSMLLLA